jgi:hypothetical protein
MTMNMAGIALRAAVASLAVALVAGLTATNASAGVGMECPGTFKVQHNDRIGKLKLPKGKYLIKVKRMECADASKYFAKFLDRPNGDLPKGWVLNVDKQKFKNKRKNIAFIVRRAGGGGGGGGGGTSGKCPGTFTVQHDDRIGKLKLPQGKYTIRTQGMSCQRASSLFTKFLDRPDGDLPNGWSLNVKRAKFSNAKRGIAFRVQQAS